MLICYLLGHNFIAIKTNNYNETVDTKLCSKCGKLEPITKYSMVWTLDSPLIQKKDLVPSK